MEGLFVNSRPIYHHETRDKALYLNNDDRWIIGSQAGAKLGDTKGHLYVKDLAHAATAAELDSRQWKCFDSAKKTWVIDPAIRVIPKPGVAPLKGVLAASPNVAPQKGAHASVLIPQKIALAAVTNADRKEDPNKNASAARRHSIMRQESFQMKTARLQATKDTERIRQEAKLEDRKLSRLNTRTPRGGAQAQGIQAPLPALRAPEVSSDEELGSLSTDSEDASVLILKPAGPQKGARAALPIPKKLNVNRKDDFSKILPPTTPPPPARPPIPAKAAPPKRASLHTLVGCDEKTLSKLEKCGGFDKGWFGDDCKVCGCSEELHVKLEANKWIPDGLLGARQ
jgi:hypothetical protein